MIDPRVHYAMKLLLVAIAGIVLMQLALVQMLTS